MRQVKNATKHARHPQPAKHNRDYVSFHRTLRNSADSGIQHLEPTEQTKQASCTARFGDPKGRVSEDPGAVPMKQTPGSPLKCRVAVMSLTRCAFDAQRLPWPRALPRCVTCESRADQSERREEEKLVELGKKCRTCELINSIS